MKFPISTRKGSTALARFVAASLTLAFVALVAEAANEAVPSLDDYLKRVGYLPVDLKRDGHDRFLAEAVLAGKKRLLLVDTGWGKTALDKDAARGLKSLGELGVTLDDSFLGKVTDPSIVLMDKLTLGRAQFLNQPAKVMKLQKHAEIVGFNGALGCDFFFRNYCLIDCFSRRLYVRGAKPSDETTSAIEASLRGSGFTSVPIDVKYGLSVEAKVNDERFKLLVDTGSEFTTLDTALAKRLGLAAEKHDRVASDSRIKKELSANIVGVGHAGVLNMWVATLETLEIGSLQWTNVHVGVASLKSWAWLSPETKPRKYKEC